MIHAILVDGKIERIDGSILDADNAVNDRKALGHSAIYLFEARDDQEYERKRQADEDRHRQFTI